VTHRDVVDNAATLLAYQAAAESAGSEAAALARAIWDGLDSDRWTLEWQLPVWIGDAFGLDREVTHRIQAGTVLGLAAIRIEDDLADGEVPMATVAAARVLGTTLYEAALAPYRELLAGDDEFWARLTGWMAEWRRHRSAETDPLEVRGAPLKIPALAICRLAERDTAFAALERAIDHALRGLVLFDHAVDWRADLAAGRWNAFAGSERDPHRVEAAMLVGGLVRPHFARIDRELGRAARVAGSLRIDGLAAHLTSVRTSIRAEGARLEARYDMLGNQTLQLFFGPYAT
jgi:hypothetical protein